MVACQASGNWVDEWLPQIARSRTSRTGTPAFAASGIGRGLVEHGHGEPSVPRHAVARGSSGADQRVRVARVADHQHAAVVGRVAGDRLALAGEDAAVDAQQVLALHPLPARDGADQERPVGAVEGLIGVGGADDRVEQREGAVLELHAHAVERRQGGRQLQQLEPDRGVRAEHLARRDAEEQRVADLAGGAGHRDAYGRVGHRSPVEGSRRV